MSHRSAVHLVRRWVLLLPADFAGRRIDGVDAFLFALAREGVDAASGHDWRGVSQADFNFPLQVELFRKILWLFGDDASLMGASPAGPVGGYQGKEQNQSHESIVSSLSGGHSCRLPAGLKNTSRLERRFAGKNARPANYESVPDCFSGANVARLKSRVCSSPPSVTSATPSRSL